MKNGFLVFKLGDKAMDSTKSIKKIHEPKIVDTVIFHGKYVDAIRREIDLIKRWRQKDNKIKSYLTG